VNTLGVSPEETGRAVQHIPAAQCQEKGLVVAHGGMDWCEESSGGCKAGGVRPQGPSVCAARYSEHCQTRRCQNAPRAIVLVGLLVWCCTASSGR